MSGPNTKPSSDLANTDITNANTFLRNSTEDRATRNQVMAPVINFNEKMASGDRKAMTEAAAPILTQIAQQSAQARENIYNTAPRGAAQDFALSELPVQTADAASKALAAPFLQSFQNLTNLGGMYGNSALQYAGASISSNQAAGQALNDVMQAQAAKKAATMGFLGNVVGAAGQAASGRL